MTADSIVRRKAGKRSSEIALDRDQKVVVKIPTQLIQETRAHAALQGERGPGPVIRRALLDYLKRNPIPARSL